MVLIENYIMQILLTMGIILFFGFIIESLTILLYKILGVSAHKIFLLTGVIGVPIHEFGHAFFAVLFGHKVNRVVWFTTKNPNYLGCVEHSYNKRNPIHRIGNFFIGAGPIILGSIILTLLMLLLVPETFGVITKNVSSVGSVTFNAFDPKTYQYFFSMYGSIFTAIFGIHNLSNPWWWLFIFLCISIAMQMTLSIPDLQGAMDGLIFTGVLLFIIDLIIYFIKPSVLVTMTSGLVNVSIFLSIFLGLGALVLLGTILISFIVKNIIKIIS